MKSKVDTNAWRDIPGYGGAYQVNFEGQIRTWRWRGEHWLKEPRLLTQYVRKPRGKSRRSGRRYVKLTDAGGKSREVAAIRIMADVWLGGCPPGKVAYHKNGVLTDHHYNNIGFATPQKLGQMTGAKSGRKPVAKVDERGEIVEYYPSARTAAKANHMSYQTVLDRCNGKVKKPYALDGHTYQFAE